MAPTQSRKDTGLEEDFDDPDVKAFVRALERLASDGANIASERKHLLTIGLFLAAYMSTTKRSKLNRRLLEQMASVRRLPGNSTEEERLLRASMIVESCAREFQISGRRSVLVRLARRVAIETAEPGLLSAMKDKESAAFIAETLRQWVPKAPRSGQKATTGVLGALVFRFRLWGISTRDEAELPRTIGRRIREARQPMKTRSSPARRTRTKRE